MDSIPGEGAEPKKDPKPADSMPREEKEPHKSSASSNPPAASTCTATMADSQGETQPELDLESELAAILEESQMGSQGLENAANPAQASSMPNIGSVSSTIANAMKEVTAAGDELENQLDDMLNSQGGLQPSQSAP